MAAARTERSKLCAIMGSEPSSLPPVAALASASVRRRLVGRYSSSFTRTVLCFQKHWIRSMGFYYGDSGIFVRRSVYEALGGFRPIPLMEDLEFVRRLERFGRTSCIKNPPLTTSSRRFEKRHPAQIVYGWVRLHVLFWLGASPDQLAKIYKRHVPPPARADR